MKASPEGEAARAIAATEPVAAKKAPGKTKKPLAPERVAAILDALRKTYPEAVCALNHRNAWELTVATILSAQCTDARVNLATPELFQSVSDAEGYGCGFPARVGGADPDDGVLSEQGEVDPGCGTCGGGAVRGRGAADDGGDC